MTRPRRPYNNQVYHHIQREFRGGFCQLDVIGALQEIGFSKGETKRLLNQGGIKIWDTQIINNGKHYQWYLRNANEQELVEPEDIFIFGKPKALIIQEKK